MGLGRLSLTTPDTAAPVLQQRGDRIRWHAKCWASAPVAWMKPSRTSAFKYIERREQARDDEDGTRWHHDARL
jgi:hypothetical protein